MYRLSHPEQLKALKVGMVGNYYICKMIGLIMCIADAYEKGK